MEQEGISCEFDLLVKRSSKKEKITLVSNVQF